MHQATAVRARWHGLSWYRRTLVALAALLMAASVALAGMSAGDPVAAADDSAVVAGGSWSNARSLMKLPADMLGGSWS